MTKRKFTDEQLQKKYNKGLTDIEIAHIFYVAKNAVTTRRWKLHLPPNHTLTTKTITNYNQHLKQIATKHKPQIQQWTKQHKKQEQEQLLIHYQINRYTTQTLKNTAND
jgi:hypothetical protein